MLGIIFVGFGMGLIIFYCSIWLLQKCCNSISITALKEVNKILCSKFPCALQGYTILETISKSVSGENYLREK